MAARTFTGPRFDDNTQRALWKLALAWGATDARFDDSFQRLLFKGAIALGCDVKFNDEAQAILRKIAVKLGVASAGPADQVQLLFRKIANTYGVSPGCCGGLGSDTQPLIVEVGKAVVGPTPEPPVTCGEPSDFIGITGGSTADGIYAFISPGLWRKNTPFAYELQFDGTNWDIVELFGVHTYRAVLFPCTWEILPDGLAPAPVGYYIQPTPSAVDWSPPGELASWFDGGGPHSGDLPTFLATADVPTVNSLSFSGSGNLTALTGLQGLPALATLDCNTNTLATLDLTNCTALTTLNCSSNASLTTLTLTGCAALVTVDCNYCDIQPTLDVSPSGASLTSLYCSQNFSLSSLILSGCSSITTLDCSYCNLNPTLDLSDCSSLVTLMANNNTLTSLIGLNGNANIGYVDFAFNSVAAINITNCTALTYLDVNPNLLTTLDLSTCTSLNYTDCSNNLMGSLGGSITVSASMTILVCNFNQLTSLNVAPATSMVTLLGDNNLMNPANVGAVLCALDANGVLNGILHIDFNSVPDAAGLVCSASLDPGKGWTVTHD